MKNDRIRRVARIDRHELAEMPSTWSNRERGRYLRILVRFRGIDPDGLFQVEYYPYRTCWLLIQEPQAEDRPATTKPTSLQPDETFYLQTLELFRRSARTAFAAAAAKSLHFASHGSSYELPSKPQEVTAARLADLLGGNAATDPSVRFNAEGGWQNEASEN